MASTLLYLVRHGAHKHPPAGGDPDPGLSPLGEQQARLLGPRLADIPFDVLLHSPLRRATQTAQVLSGYLPGVPVQPSDLLRDRTAVPGALMTEMRMDDPYGLERFVTAQDSGGTFDQATAELRRGRKASHWMWFVFPQVAGLGQSPTARRFAISSLEEARAYLHHPVLGPRLAEAAGILAATTGRTAQQIFGGLDAQKLRSSMTLFQRAAPDDPLFGRVIDQYFDGIPDSATDRLL